MTTFLKIINGEIARRSVRDLQVHGRAGRGAGLLKVYWDESACEQDILHGVVLVLVYITTVVLW